MLINFFKLIMLLYLATYFFLRVYDLWPETTVSALEI